LNKTFISEVCIKPVALRINRYTRSSSQFHRCWWPLQSKSGRENEWNE